MQTVKEAIRKATEAQNWDEVERLEKLRQVQLETRLKEVEVMQKIQEVKIARATALKTLAESDKITRDNKFGVVGVLTAVISAGIAIGTFIKSLFK